MNKKCKECEIEMIDVRRNKIFCSTFCKTRNYWKNNSDKKKNRDNLRKRRRIIKERIVNLKGGSCNKCGYNTSLKALDLHHSKGEKDIIISKILYHKWDTIIGEVEKCDLLCSNCHIKEHSFLNEESKDYQNKLRKFLRNSAGNKCSNCDEDDERVLVFHHIKEENKEFQISAAIASRWHLEKVIPEVKKCTLLCSNCHREHHDNDCEKNIKMKRIKIKKEDAEKFNNKNGHKKICKMCSSIFNTTRRTYYFCSSGCETKYAEGDYGGKYVKICGDCGEEFQTLNKNKVSCGECKKGELIKKRKSIRREKSTVKYNKECKECKKEFTSLTKGAKYCSKNCVNTAQRVYTDEELDKIKNKYVELNYNLTKTGKFYGISDNALKKIIIKYFPEEWKMFQEEKEKNKYKKCKGEGCNKKIKKRNNKGNPTQNYCSDECKIKARKMCIYDEDIIVPTLKKNNYNVAKTARELELSRKGLTKWIKRNIGEKK